MTPKAAAIASKSALLRMYSVLLRRDLASSWASGRATWLVGPVRRILAFWIMAWVTASMVLVAPRSGTRAPAVESAPRGIMSNAMVTAAGALMSDAVSRWPTAFGTTGAIMVA